jgi:sarcosine oxidase
MSSSFFDVIVIGVGGMGSAAACELARRGRRVLGLEQFTVGHDQGSSHGHTRIIRKAYYEHPDYVPLVQRAYQRWYDLEQRQGRHLLTECPCLSLGPPDGELIAGVRESAARHHLPIENLSAAEVRKRYPMFHVSDQTAGVLERSAGFLYVDECVQAYAREAKKLGATIREHEPVISWSAHGNAVVVETATNRYSAERLVLTAGPWMGRLLAALGARLTVMRQVVFWFGTRDDRLFRRDVFPVYIAETPDGPFYGLPMLDSHGVKVARHYGAPELQDPAAVDRNVSLADEAVVQRFLSSYLPAVEGPLGRASVCLYTLTHDRHFLIDVHPEHPNVVFAAGFSGHGFKFASAVGEILADLADEGKSRLPIDLFRLARFAPAPAP